MGFSTQQFLAQIGQRLNEPTTHPRETTFMLQRLSIAIQRFNAACLADAFPISESAPVSHSSREFVQFNISALRN